VVATTPRFVTALSGAENAADVANVMRQPKKDSDFEVMKEDWLQHNVSFTLRLFPFLEKISLGKHRLGVYLADGLVSLLLLFPHPNPCPAEKTALATRVSSHARLFLFLRFALLAGGLAGNVVRPFSPLA